MKAILWAMACNALWQVPLLALAARIAARQLAAWQSVWRVFIWRIAVVASVSIPLASSLVTLPSLNGFPAGSQITSGSGGRLFNGAPSPVAGVLSDYLWATYAVVTCLIAARLVLRLLALTRLRADNIRVPMTFGLVASRVLLPTRFAREAAPKVLSITLAHEHAHVRNHDFAWNLAIEILTLPVAFHPVLGWVMVQLRTAVELRCDEHAAVAIGDVRTYSQGLLEAAEFLQQSARVPLVSTLFDQDCLEKRVENLMIDKLKPSRWSRLAATASLTAGLVVVGLTSIQFGRSAQVGVPAEGETIHSLKEEGMKAPKVLQRFEPQYSESAREKKISGTVVLGVVISKSGKITEAKVIRSLEESLDQNAIASVKSWIFEPATKNDQPISVRATVEVKFQRN